ncbi:MAG: MBL fold metallo-hydrolase [bacterium]|jgi:phosphoribosyl 1,2-cyclic phosphate phosphodiesterase|nr:MBL fold metallo-hydrolase [candidate division KSB1 bacterium]MDH7559428.1 MBL fold metallo-hydrolase [bacterium]
MLIEFLGTGGATTIPRPLCSCRVCAQARERGVPYSRSGPSLFIHGPDILIDTPEESAWQLARSAVRHVNGCLYSHWHPDHTAGRRVFEMNMDWLHWPQAPRCCDVYLPPRVAADFRRGLGLWNHFSYLQEKGVVRVVELAEGEELLINGARIRPIPLAVGFVYAFLVEEGQARLLVVADEHIGWQAGPEVAGVDLAVLPMGIPEFHPLSGARLVAADHPILQSEATFAQTLELVRSLAAKRVILTHIEEPCDLSYDDLRLLEARLQEEGLPVSFAFDTQIVSV